MQTPMIFDFDLQLVLLTNYISTNTIGSDLILNLELEVTNQLKYHMIQEDAPD